MQTIAILLTVFNRKMKTLECLEHLYKQIPLEGYKVDVYLTDDGCTDGTPKAVKEQFPDVNIIQGNGNLFWNRGMYTAWEAATQIKDYDFYLWLNDDTYIYPESLEYMLNSCTKLGNHCIIVGATCSIKDDTHTTYSGFIGKHLQPMKKGVFQKVEKFNGNFVLIPQSVYKILGKNDPYYRHSFGDIDYGLRANKKGIPCYITDRFIGTCEEHDKKIKCFDPNYSLKERIKFFYSPLGMNPFEFYHMNRQSLGLLKAVAVFMSTHIRVMFPKLWK